jgi:hypothetical protein
MNDLYAQEFTPELDDAFLKKLLRPIEERGQQLVGSARSEALARGLTGDPFEASAVGGARRDTSNALADTTANFGYTRAGMQREERLTKQGQDFSSAEAGKARDFTAEQNAASRALQRELGFASMDNYNDPFLGQLMGLGGQVAGGWLAGRK